MRTGRIVVLGLMLTLIPAGCARDGDDDAKVASARSGAATATAGPGATPMDGREAALKYAQCMRQNGMTWYPDPQPGGGTIVKTPRDMDPKKFEAAQQACRQFAPDGGDASAPDPEILEKGRQMARCMRENGVPEFPDPQPDGSSRIDSGKLGSGPGDPVFDKAEQKCSQYLPGMKHGGQEAPA